MEAITSAFDAISELSVNELIEAPELFDQAMQELIDGEQAYKTMFHTYNTPDPVVKYEEDSAAFLIDDLQPIAEFGEIPVSDPVADKEYKFAAVEASALAIRISHQQKVRNANGEVQRELKAFANTVMRGNGLAAKAAIEAAGIEEFEVTHAWDTAEADIREDIGLVTDLIMGAVDKNGRQYNYSPSVLWANPVTINQVIRHKSITKDFVGNMASENPMFKKIGQNPLLGGYLQVVPDLSVPRGEAYIAVEGAVGLEAQNAAPRFTSFYEEGGQSGMGGPRRSYRSDYVHDRALFVPSPKAIVKLTGLKTGL